MPQTVQSAPPEVTRTETGVSPLPATEKDFHAQSPRTANHFRIWLSAAIVVLLVAAFFVYRYVTSYESTDDAQVDGHVNSISARISGHVIKLNVEDNQYVQAGTVLVEIDPTDYQVAYDRAKADFDDAQAAAVAASRRYAALPRAHS